MIKIFDSLAKEINDENLYPMASFLDAIPENDFPRYIDNLSQGHGTGFEGVTACLFPAELDEFMVASGEGFENGVQFIFFEDEIVVDIDTFWKYLRMACEVYWAEHAEDKTILETYLARPKPSLELPPEVTEWMGKWKRGEYSQIAKAT